jgi:cytochrome c553
VVLAKISGTNPSETWQAIMPVVGATEFLASSVVQVGVTAREVQKLLNATFNAFTTNLTLWNIQPGLGTVMVEYGRRFAMLKKAADAGDWGTAQYQLTEALEIQETGETTRAAKAPLLMSFEQTYLDPLIQDVVAKDTNNFTTHFSQAINGCNACHALTGHPYVSFQPPTNAPEALLLLAASNPSQPTTNPPPAAITPALDTPLTWPEVWQQIGDAMNTVDTRLALWNIQPGLGTVMMEYGRRFEMMKLAADAGDWGMAQYQLTEAEEIQEVGETTRPAKAPLLKNFEQAFLDPLAQDILAKNTNNFTTHLAQAINGCNACHALTGHPYVSVQTPATSPEPFLLLAASDPATPKTNAPFAPLTPAFGPEAPAGADALNLISNRLSVLDRNMALWNIQPGLGTVMQEYGYRFAVAWFAAEDTNWDMAAYQLTEALEIQETGETTRPANAPLLKSFEQTYLTPINTAITNKNKTAFESAYNSAMTGCNACHALTGHPYVRVQISPVVPADFLKLAP